MFISHARASMTYTRLFFPTALMAAYWAVLNTWVVDIDVCKAAYHGSLPPPLRLPDRVASQQGAAALPTSAPALQAAWAAVNAAMCALQYATSPIAPPSCGHSPYGGSWFHPASAGGVPALCECVQLMSFVRIVLCFAAPLAVTYLLEYRFRRRFAEQRGFRLAGPAPGGFVSGLDGAGFTVTAALVLHGTHVVLGMLWQLLGMLARLAWAAHLGGAAASAAAAAAGP